MRTTPSSSATTSRSALVGENGIKYTGAGMRFRIIGGRYRIVIQGRGIDLSVVGKGFGSIKGDPGQFGVYSLDGADCRKDRASLQAAARGREALRARGRGREEPGPPRGRRDDRGRPDDPGRRGRGFDRLVRLALPQERGLRRARRHDGQRRTDAGRLRAARADHPRPDAARTSTGSRSAAACARPRTFRS